MFSPRHLSVCNQDAKATRPPFPCRHHAHRLHLVTRSGISSAGNGNKIGAKPARKMLPVESQGGPFLTAHRPARAHRRNGCSPTHSGAAVPTATSPLLWQHGRVVCATVRNGVNPLNSTVAWRNKTGSSGCSPGTGRCSGRMKRIETSLKLSASRPSQWKLLLSSTTLCQRDGR